MRKFSVLFICVIFASSCASVKTVERGNVNAPMAKAVQDTKDALNTYKFDLQKVDESSSRSSLSGKRDTKQEAWVKIEQGAGSSSAVEVKVNKEGKDAVGADVIFKDIKGRSQ